MTYLLIDFGATNVKCTEYDRRLQHFTGGFRFYESPFVKNDSITKEDLIKYLENIVESFHGIDAILMCTIMGGYWETVVDGHSVTDIYRSWKYPIQYTKNFCMMSGCFLLTPNFHIHEHHRETTDISHVSEYTTELKILGTIKGIPLYSALADTQCVIDSFDLKDDEVLINMGTGSQLVYKENGKIKKYSYIPAGRAFEVFNKFFLSVGEFSLYDYFNLITVKDVLESTLMVDLRVFPGAIQYKYSLQAPSMSPGSISNISESNTLTMTNLAASILRSFVNQYLDMISPEQTKIILTGGIPTKIPKLKRLFEHYCTDKEIIIDDNIIPSTFIGMIKHIP